MSARIQTPAKQLSEKIIPCLRSSAWISHGAEALTLVVFIILRIYYAWGSWANWLLIIGIILFLCSAIWSIFLRPIFIYKNTRYDISEDFLQIKTGAFHEEQQIIPMTKIQAVSTNQGPILRKYGLYTITVQTMGSSHGIMGLPKEISLELRNQIAVYAKIEEVEEE